MMAKTHSMGGMLAGTMTFGVCSTMLNTDITTSPILTITYLTCSVIGSLLPDIDHPESKVGRKVKPISKIINKAFGHRGATHAPIVIGSITLILLTLSSVFLWNRVADAAILGTFIGAISHVALDTLNKGGTPLLYPIKKGKFNILNIGTGGKIESGVYLVLLVSFTYFLNKQIGII